MYVLLKGDKGKAFIRLLLSFSGQGKALKRSMDFGVAVNDVIKELRRRCSFNGLRKLSS